MCYVYAATLILPTTLIQLLSRTGAADSLISEPVLFTAGSDTTDWCNIYLKNRSLLKNIRMTAVIDSNLFIVKDSVQRIINTADVMKIVFPAGAGFLKGAAIGMGISLGFWGILGATSGSGEGIGIGLAIGLLYGIPVALVGGLIGAFGDRDDVYYLMNMKPENKIKRIKYIMSFT